MYDWQAAPPFVLKFYRVGNHTVGEDLYLRRTRNTTASTKIMFTCFASVKDRDGAEDDLASPCERHVSDTHHQKCSADIMCCHH